MMPETDALIREAWALLHTSPGRSAELAREARQAALASGHTLESARAQLALGAACLEMGDLGASEEKLQEALPILEESGDLEGVLEANRLLGRLYMSKGRLDDAARHYLRAQDAVRPETPDAIIARLRNELGVLYSSLGAYGEGLEQFQASLALVDGDSKFLPVVLNNLGNVHALQETFTQALDYFERAYAAAKDAGNVRSRVIMLGNLAKSSSRLGDHERAIELVRAALLLSEYLGERAHLPSSLSKLAEVLLASG